MSYREIYIYLVIRLYIILYINNKIIDYQNIRDFTPLYLIISYMSRDRFQELYIYI